MKRIMAALLTLLCWGVQTSFADTGGKTDMVNIVRPKFQEEGQGVLRCETAPALFVGNALKKTDTTTYQPLQERLAKQFSAQVEPAAPPAKLPEQPFVLVGLVSDHPALQKLEAEMKTRLPQGGLGDEGYLIEITPAHALVAAEKPAGAFYGVQTLLALSGDATQPFSLPVTRIADYPALKWRGMHILVNNRSNLPAIEQLLTQHLPHHRLNRLILEINYAFQYKSHPEVAAEDGLTVEDCRHLSQLAKQNHIHLIPMLNCLGHQSWAKQTFKLLTAHPEFDETPDLPADNPGIYCRSWCPLHPDINKVVFALFDELLDAFQADAFHVGLDEVFILGKCPRCKGKDTAELFAQAVKDYHSHLVGKRKVTMLMWADRLLDSKTTAYGEWEASANGTAPAIERIPKDIVLCDWHYEKGEYPSVPYLQEKGFRVWPSGWNKAENAQKLVETSLKHQGERLAGYLATTWFSVVTLANDMASDAQGQPISGREAGLIAAIKKAAQMAWEGE